MYNSHVEFGRCTASSLSAPEVNFNRAEQHSFEHTFLSMGTKVSVMMRVIKGKLVHILFPFLLPLGVYLPWR